MAETKTTTRPIIMSAESVRAILDERKTQTRRIVKFPLWLDEGGKDCRPVKAKDILRYCTNRYGQAGDRLWVKEPFHYKLEADNFYYTADKKVMGIEAYIKLSGKKGSALRSVFMPRWASRITLEVTDVRVTRVTSICDNDAVAEGCSSVDEFRQLWNTINEKRGASWESDPWVWVVSFRQVRHE